MDNSIVHIHVDNTPYLTNHTRHTRRICRIHRIHRIHRKEINDYIHNQNDALKVEHLVHLGTLEVMVVYN
jgi:hypothetical protein